MNKKICRLCLQTINGNYETMEQTFYNTLKLNMDISKEAVKCIECTNNFEMFLKFKSACERTLTTDLKDNIHLDLNEIETTDDLISSMDFKNEIKCCFCTKTSEREGLTSLNESKEYMFLVNVLKEYIPKLDLNITEELLTCETCLDGLQSVSSFLINCMNVEQKINKYTELKGTGDNGQIELEDVQQFIIEPIIKYEIDSRDINEFNESDGEFENEYTMQTDTEIKYEKDVENIELFTSKTEKVYIKSEQNDYDRDVKDEFDTMQTRAEIKYEKEIENTKLNINPEEIDVKSEQRDDDSLQEARSKLQRRRKKCVNEQELTYKNSEGITIYKCGTCPYETKHKYYIRSHKLIHKSSSEITMFKCELCPYESKHRQCLERHKLIHKNTSELPLFKCDLCSYKGKRMDYLTKHKLTHKPRKSTPKLIKFKCELCSYGTSRRYHLKLHKLTHKSNLEITMFKCELCPYESKRRQCLDRHKLIHKSTSELTMFKCEHCPYETKRIDHLKKHALIHKSCSDVTMFKCELCPLETKRRDNLRRHKLTHINPHNPK